MSGSVSVVIPSYNRAHYLPRAVASVLAQTVPVQEVLIVDDGSTDDTEAVVGGLSGPIRYFRKPNGGPGSARNVGIREARGQYVALLDTDDVWLPGKIARQVEILDTRPEVVLVHTAAAIIGADGRPTGDVWGKPEYRGWVRKKLLFANGINASSVLARKSVLEAAGGYDERFLLLENWELWLRVSRHGEFAYLEDRLIQYRIHDDNSISNLDRLELSFERFLDKHLHPERSRLPPVLRRRIVAQHYRALADARTGQGDYAGARGAFLRSLGHHVWQPGVMYRLFRVVTAEAAGAAGRWATTRAGSVG